MWPQEAEMTDAFLKSSIIKTIELMLAWSIQQNQM